VIVNNPNLSELNFSYCNLSTLTLNNNPSLAKIECYNSNLSNLNFLINCNKDSLNYLDVSNNKLTGNLQGLIPKLGQFTNLETLFLNNNPLTGSLDTLLNLSKLKEL